MTTLDANRKTSAAAEDFHIVIKKHDDCRMLTMAGWLGADEVGRLRETLNGLRSSSPSSVVLDLSEVEHISSLALGALLQFRQAVVASGGKVVLTGLRSQVMRMFALVGLPS